MKAVEYFVLPTALGAAITEGGTFLHYGLPKGNHFVGVTRKALANDLNHAGLPKLGQPGTNGVGISYPQLCHDPVSGHRAMLDKTPIDHVLLGTHIGLDVVIGRSAGLRCDAHSVTSSYGTPMISQTSRPVR